MSKVILTEKLVIELGRMIGVKYTQFGHDKFNVGNAEGLFVEAFIDHAKTGYMNDEAEMFVAEEEDVIEFFQKIAEENNRE